jgi:hypothetical protein
VAGPYADPSYINVGGVNTGGYGGNINLQAGNGLYSGNITFSLPTLPGTYSSGNINFLIPYGLIKIGTTTSSLPMTIYGNGNLTTSGTILSSTTITGYSFVSTVTSAAPFGISSTTKVNNLNVDMLDGLHAPASGIAGLSDVQTLTNKTLTSPTINGGTINTATISGGTINNITTGAFTTLNANSATISGGTINGATIGATTPSTGAFSSLTASNNAIINSGICSINIGSAWGESTGWGSGYLGFNMNRSNSNWYMINDGGNNNGGALIYTDIGGNLRFVTVGSFGSTSRYITDEFMLNNVRMIITKDGNIGMGTSNTQGYKLAVNGGIIAEEVKVITDVPEADYVFKNNYSLMPLNQVERYVNEHRHLPEVPSAEQFKKDGYKVGEMDNLLLRKVEELTLYVIELKKENERLAKEVENLKNK